MKEDVLIVSVNDIHKKTIDNYFFFEPWTTPEISLRFNKNPEKRKRKFDKLIVQRARELIKERELEHGVSAIVTATNTSFISSNGGYNILI